jgi:hypothetical protein
MDEFASPALNVYLDGLAPSSKLAYMNASFFSGSSIQEESKEI